MEKTHILFDLDGTITDPKEGITKSVQYSLASLGIHIQNTDDFIPFIGPPLRDSYKKYFNLSEAETEKAVEKYREYYVDQGIYQNVLYTGMDVFLKKLQDMGRHLILATAKPTIYAERILEHFGIRQAFTFISGSELDGRRSRKGESIQYALQNVPVPDRQRAIMVGDRGLDIIGAKENGIESIGVLFGYGGMQELTDAGATYIADTVGMLDMLLS